LLDETDILPVNEDFNFDDTNYIEDNNKQE